MRALLVDDERLARVRLRALLGAHPEVIVIGEAASLEQAVTAVQTHRPDVIFLDIEMGAATGFDLLAQEPVDAHVVFVTAYNEHAVRAFEVGALDYLMKPVEPERLMQTLERLKHAQANTTKRFSLGSGASLRRVAASDIVIVLAAGDYSTLVLRDGSEVSHKATLASWEERLGESFERVHRGTLVSLSDIERFERAEGSTYQVFLRGRSEPIPVSRARARALRDALRLPSG